jgi:hypothetical protein
LEFQVPLFRKCSICLAIIVLFAFCFVPVGLAIGSNEADDALGRAEVDLGSAFAAVADAERAGANVTAFVGRLNYADGFLAEGYAAYRSANYESAISIAASCSSATEGIVDDAAYLKASAERARSDTALMTAVISGVGLTIFFILAFLGWRILKKFYSKRVLEFKPIVEGSK